MDGSQRRLMGSLAVLALLCAGLQALTGVVELSLYLTPLFLILTLLASGRYLGEERILAHWQSRTCTPRPRRITGRFSAPRTRALASLLARSPRSLRGPPAALPRTA